MRQFSPFFLIIIVAAGADAQVCELRGESLTQNVSVQDADGRHFVVKASAPLWTVSVLGRLASTQVKSFLSFEGSVSTAELDIRFREPTTIEGVVQIRDRYDARVVEPDGHGHRLRARVSFGSGLSVQSVHSCNALVIADSAQRHAYEQGFEGSALNHGYKRCAEAHPDAPNQAWLDGRRDGEAYATEEPPSSSALRWVPRASPLRVRAQRAGRDVRLTIPTTTVLSEIERDGVSVRVQYRWGHSVLKAWVLLDELVAAPASGYGWGAGGFRGRAARVPRLSTVRGTLRIGTPVYSARDASAPWAHVQGLGTVTAQVQGEWARLTAVPSTRVREDVMWVRLADLTLHRHHSQGLTVTPLALEPFYTQRSMIVMEVRPGSRAERVGLRGGDIVQTPRARPLRRLLEYPVRIVRGTGELVLLDPCIEALSAELAQIRSALH